MTTPYPDDPGIDPDKTEESPVPDTDNNEDAPYEDDDDDDDDGEDDDGEK